MFNDNMTYYAVIDPLGYSRDAWSTVDAARAARFRDERILRTTYAAWRAAKLKGLPLGTPEIAHDFNI